MSKIKYKIMQKELIHDFFNHKNIWIDAQYVGTVSDKELAIKIAKNYKNIMNNYRYVVTEYVSICFFRFNSVDVWDSELEAK